MEARYEAEYRLMMKTGARPLTRKDVRDAVMPLVAGSDVMLHVSLNNLGWISGGPLALIQGVTDAVDDGGHIIMPAHSNDISDPRLWGNPPAPEGWIDQIMESLPPYDRETASCRRLGRTPELFRTLPDVKRSAHPHYSLACFGPDADMILDSHPLDFSMGDQSPLARLYDRNVRILLMGVGFENCTMLHLAENRAADAESRECDFIAPVSRSRGKTIWKSYRDIDFDSDVFEKIGDGFCSEYPRLCSRGRLGFGTILSIPSRKLVDYAVDFLDRRGVREGG